MTPCIYIFIFYYCNTMIFSHCYFLYKYFLWYFCWDLLKYFYFNGIFLIFYIISYAQPWKYIASPCIAFPCFCHYKIIIISAVYFVDILCEIYHYGLIYNPFGLDCKLIIFIISPCKYLILLFLLMLFLFTLIFDTLFPIFFTILLNLLF